LITGFLLVNAWLQYRIQQAYTWFQKAPKLTSTILRSATFATNKLNIGCDVCYFIGENTPIYDRGSPIPELPVAIRFMITLMQR